jgi:ribulose-phosphate 3-epimerase
VKIAPSILAADFTRLGEQIREAEAAGGDQIHIDIMDGRFVPTISFGVPVVAAARRATRLPLDVHLMIVEPEHHLAAFKEAGADILTVHIEACPNLHRVLQQIRGLGLRAGVALNPHTPAILLSEILHLVDVVLVMTVNPGAGGQTFLNETLPKIKTLRGMAPNVDISVDGGIEESTIRAAKDAGANVFVAGTSIFGAQGGIQAGVERLKRALG